jgi:secondary thiamine-phosphate synthase enzyme
MQLVGAPGIVSAVRQLVIPTDEAIQFIDITDQVSDFVAEQGVSNGTVTIFTRHTTAAIRIQEDEPLLLRDLKEFLEKLAPRGAHYHHNDFRIRTEHMHEDESPNGNSHCLQLLLGTSESIPVVNSKMLLGTWQRIFFVELDGPRPGNGPVREVLLQAFGTRD